MFMPGRDRDASWEREEPLSESQFPRSEHGPPSPTSSPPPAYSAVQPYEGQRPPATPPTPDVIQGQLVLWRVCVNVR